MVENYDDISCEDVIYSEDYRDYIKEYFQDFSSIAGTYHPVCIEAIGSRYAVMHLAGDTSMQNILSDYNISMLPALYGLLGTAGLEESGILYFHRSPYLNLRGSGVMIGVIDTGIDYRHQAFTYEDRTTKIYSIWDQTIRDGESPEGFIYGTEYTSEQINRALAAENSLAVVPSQDENGHGTFIAGVAAGRVIESEDFSGAAPEASLCIVKLKPCKQYLRQFYGTAADVPAYQENDIMAGISYCIQKAKEARMPVIILLGVGTNSGGHTGQSYLSQLIDDISGFSGVCVVTAVGGEADKRHHFLGVLPEDSAYTEAEIRVGAGERAFSLELWSMHPDLYISYIEMISKMIPVDELRKNFCQKFSQKNMLKTFHEGKTDISMDTAFACSKEAQVSVLRVNVDMARNSFSKEIGAVLHFTDITAGYLVENVPQKIYQKNYENIIIIDANRKKMIKTDILSSVLSEIGRAHV